MSVMTPNLHYENMPGIPLSPKQMMEHCFYGFNEIYRYLASSIKWLFNKSLRINWKHENEDDHQSSSIEDHVSKDKFQHHSGNCRVVLIDIEGDKGEDVLDQFLDAGVSEVYDTEKLGKAPIRVLEKNAEKGTLLLSRHPNGYTLYPPPSTYTLEKQLDSLHFLQNQPLHQHLPLLKLALPSLGFEWPEIHATDIAKENTLIWSGTGTTATTSYESYVPKKWYFLNDPGMEGTDEQKKFVRIALDTPDFAILEGPPGSGKTTAICEYILQEINRGRKVLLCASTHVAVDNVLESLDLCGYMEKDVIAVRIGDETNISEVTRKFGLKDRIQTERTYLISKLSSIKDPLPSQKFLLDSLMREDSDTIQKLILDCSNLVCGTTIGILRHPDMKYHAVSKDKSFDTLIIDEASKTTFPEFLVPALYAKKWILVGDIKQLSPYVDDGLYTIFQAKFPGHF